jgi:hypothetical protein
MNRANRPTHSDHLRHSKRRRTSPISSPTDDAINRLVPSRNQSPIAATTAALGDHIHPSQHESSSDEDNDAPSSQLLFTQLSFVSTQPSTTLSPLHQSTVKYCKAPSSITSVKDLLPDDLSIIQDVVADLYPSISTIRDFQYEAIHQLAFNDDASLILIRCTADGKSLVPAITSALRGGVSIILVPLHGLGSDQVESAENNQFGIEAYYVDEHHFSNAKMLQGRLKLYSKQEAEESTIILYVSPNSIREYTDSTRKHRNPWFPIFYSLAKEGIISLLAIDEAHAVEQAGQSIRRKFVDAVLAMEHLFDVMPTPVPRLAISATFRQEDYDRVVSLFGLDDAIVMQGDLSQRRTFFACHVAGNPAGTLLQKVTSNLTPTNQQLMYCNSRLACENSLVDRSDKILDKHLRSKGHQAVATSFTGGDGLKIKTAIMDAFTNSTNLPGEAALNADGPRTLPKISLLAATSAANCGLWRQFK